TMAGYPLQEGNEYYQRAADKAAEVINAQQFSLFDSYDDLHDPSMKNIGENIFMIQFATKVIPSNWQVAIIRYNKNISQYSVESAGIHATAVFLESYEPGNLRAQEKQFFYTQYTHESNRNQTVVLGGYFIWKHFDYVAQTSTANSALSWP